MLRLIFLSLILISISCSSLKTVTSEHEPSPQEDMFRLYDSKSYVRYHITNDKDSLYIKLNTSEGASIYKIAKKGLTIYFDVNGKRSKDVYFQYPLEQEKQSESIQTSLYPQKKGTELQTLITQIPDEAIYAVDKEIDRFSIFAADQDLRVSLKALNNTEILYDLAIPITKITEGGISSLENLSIGIVSGKFDVPPNSSMKGGGQGQGGGMRGGGQGGGGHSGGGSSGSRQPNGMSAMATPINIWFKIDLFKAK